jgi:hypothetical protein
MPPSSQDVLITGERLERVTQQLTAALPTFLPEGVERSDL